MDVRLTRTLLGQTQGGCGEPPCISMSFYVEWSRGADKQRPSRPAAAGAPPGIAALAHLPWMGRLPSRAPPAQKAPHSVGSWPREARPEGLWHFAGKHPCSRSSVGADACIRPRVDASIDPYKCPVNFQHKQTKQAAEFHALPLVLWYYKIIPHPRWSLYRSCLRRPGLLQGCARPAPRILRGQARGRCPAMRQRPQGRPALRA